MENSKSIFKKIENIDNKTNWQLDIVEKYISNIMNSYFNNLNIQNIFNCASEKIFNCSDFLILLNYQKEYLEIFNVKTYGYNHYYNKRKLENKEILLASLEFFYNIINTVIILATNNYSYNINIDNIDNFKKLKIEINKLIALLGYSFIESNNTNKDHWTWKIYHIIKNERFYLINKSKLEKNLKNLLLELTIENIEPKKLKEKLLIIYEEYLSPNRKNIKKYLGREIENQIFNLYNNGLVKHKEEKNIEKLSKFNDNDILDALIWLKDIILFYFTCCHKKTPEKLLIK